ncbi:hypothetical protein BJX70DRAFT_400649 [Aspergillus crustosus]
MQWKPTHPRDFIDACRRKLSEEELNNLIESSKYPPLFVYGHCMIPTVCKYFADIPQFANMDMIFATLGGFKLYHFYHKEGLPSLPAIRHSRSQYDHVEGMLIFGLTKEQRSMVFEIEGPRSEQTHLVDIHVRVSLLDTCSSVQYTSQRLVNAKTFVWMKTDRWSLQGLDPMETSCWPIDEFLESLLYANIVRDQNREQHL